jgi:outer membrane protein TolC
MSEKVGSPRRRGVRALGWLVAAPLLGAACVTVGPDYEPPQIDVPDAWHEQVEADVAEGETNLTNWWTSLNDPTLDDLVQRAAQNNRDADAAFERVREARAALGIAVRGRHHALALQ